MASRRSSARSARRPRATRWAAAAAAFTVWLWPALANAQATGDQVDPKIALPIMLKVLTYDRHFTERGLGDFTVLVVSNEAHRTQRDELVALIKSLSLSKIQARPLKFLSGEVKDQKSLDEKVAETKANAILAVPGLSSSELTVISEVAQDNQIYTLALDLSMVEKLLALGVVGKEGRPQIVINLPASRAIGAVYESSVLKLARIIQ